MLQNKLFFIDLESGTTSLDLTQADFGNLNSLQINTGGSTTEITPTSINTGDFLLSGNTIKTTSNNFVLDSQGTGNNIRFLGNVRMPTLDLSADLIINGDLLVPHKPGWGAELNEEIFNMHPPKFLKE